MSNVVDTAVLALGQPLREPTRDILVATQLLSTTGRCVPAARTVCLDLQDYAIQVLLLARSVAEVAASDLYGSRQSWCSRQAWWVRSST
ncbi:hypothetical protein XH97_02050 [Bradyrhizobium sp. CCBAU 53380]|nr:hypothetical protein [Bradyrhizobium sp. CCBAU 53380]